MQCTVVLVRPKYPRNIGMVSRAMCNFGHTRLVLIDPLCELDRNASKGAAEGQQPLRECVTYESWDDYAKHESDGPRIAYSRRGGRRRPVIDIDELTEWAPLSDGRPVSLIFGPEDHGLSREDLQWAHRTCTLDIPGPVKSLNLSHAVCLALSQLPKLKASEEVRPPEPVQQPDDDLKRWLTALNFDISSKNWNAFYALRQMIMKANPTQKEMALFHSIIEQTLRKMDHTDRPGAEAVVTNAATKTTDQ